MKAHVRKLYGGYYYLIEGTPDTFSENSKVISDHITRREAIRHGIKNGYDIIINKRQQNRNDTNAMDDALRIRVTDYGMHSIGSQAGAWLKLPATVDELATTLQKVGVEYGELGRSFFINGFESSIPTVNNLSLEHISNMSINELNYIAEQLERLPQKEAEKLGETLGMLQKLNALPQDHSKVAEKTEAINYRHTNQNSEQAAPPKTSIRSKLDAKKVEATTKGAQNQNSQKPSLPRHNENTL